VRYIDLDSIRGDQAAEAAIAAAEAAREDVASTDAADRKDKITANRERWVDFRPVFEKIVGQKCWYTESENPGTDDDVDHYRPKFSVDEAPNHGGYWWEALNWRNFRLSCHRSNRLRVNPDSGETLGKGDHFPLLNEADRWLAPANACREAPALLDPTDPIDPPILTYGTDGRAALSPDYEDDHEAAHRFKKSRYYLHLDWPTFVEHRTALYGTIATRVADGNRLADAALGGQDPSAKDALSAIARDLISLTHASRPYSSAAFAYICVFRSRLWIKKMVLPNIRGIVIG
jgi:hypothetical protein